MSTGHCSPQAQLHLHRLLEGISPQRRTRSHIADADNGSVSAVCATPQSRTTYQQWCLDELRSLGLEEGRARQRIDEDGAAEIGTWCTALHALLQWCCVEEQHAQRIWCRLHQRDQHAVDASPNAAMHPSRCTSILQAACKRIEDQAEQQQMAVTAMTEWQRRLDVVSLEAAHERDTLAQALRDSDERYEALLQESQDALHASRCAGDEVDYWEETATMKENELLQLSSALALLLDAPIAEGVVPIHVGVVATLVDNIALELREQPQARGQAACVVLLHFKRGASQILLAESVEFSGICLDWLSCAMPWLHTCRAAEASSNEAFDESVVLLEAQELHRAFLERKVLDAERALASAEAKRLKDLQAHEIEMHAVWDLLVKSQDQHIQEASAADPARAACDVAIQTSAAPTASRRRGATFAAQHTLHCDGDDRGCPTAVASKTQLADFPIGLYAFSMHFVASKYPSSPSGGRLNDSPRWSSALTLELDLLRMELRVVPIKSSTKRTSGSATPLLVVAHDILSVSRCMDDLNKLTVVLTQGKPLTLYLEHAFARERCLELLRTMQAADAQHASAPTFAASLLPDYDAAVDECPVAAQVCATCIVADGSLTRAHDMSCAATGDLLMVPIEAHVDTQASVGSGSEATAAGALGDLRPVGALTVAHASSHWQPVSMAIVCSTVSVAHPVPVEMEADATIRRDVDVLMLALHVRPTSTMDAEDSIVGSSRALQEGGGASDGVTDDGLGSLGMRSHSPGAEVEQAVANATIVSKAVHGFMCADMPLSFAVALVAEEEEVLYVMLVRKGLTAFMQHLNFTSTPAVDIPASRSGIFSASNGSFVMDPSAATAGCNARISFSIHETSYVVCVLPRRGVPNHRNHPYASQGGGNPFGGVASLYGVPPAEGTSPQSVDACCSSHYTFVVQPGAVQARDAVPMVGPTSMLRHAIVTRGGHILLLSPDPSTAERCHVSSFTVPAVHRDSGKSQRRVFVPLHRVRFATMRSHATILDSPVPRFAHSGASSVSMDDRLSSSLPRSLRVTLASLVLDEAVGAMCAVSSLQWRQYTSPADDRIVVMLCSEFGAAPLSLTLTTTGSHAGGPFIWEGQEFLQFVVPCKRCVEEKLLFVVQTIDASANPLSLIGSAATAVASWSPVEGELLGCTVPWIVRGMHVGDLQLRAHWV